MSIKEKIDKLTAEYEQSRADGNRLWNAYQAEENKVRPFRDAWSDQDDKTEKLGHRLNALKEMVKEDHTAEQIEQDWNE